MPAGKLNFIYNFHLGTKVSQTFYSLTNGKVLQRNKPSCFAISA